MRQATPKEKLCFINISVAPTSQRKKKNKTTKHLQPKLVVPCGGPSRLEPGEGRGSRRLGLQNSLMRAGRPPPSFPGVWCLWLERSSPCQSCQSHAPGFLDQPGGQQVGTPGPRAARLFLILSVSFDVPALLLFLVASKWKHKPPPMPGIWNSQAKIHKVSPGPLAGL